MAKRILAALGNTLVKLGKMLGGGAAPNVGGGPGEER